MSISKRSLIFVFAIATAFSFFAHDREAVAQSRDFKGLDMPNKYFFTPKPYVPTVDLTKEQRKVVRETLGAWARLPENKAANTAIRLGENKVKEVQSTGGDITANAETRKFLEEYTFPSMTQTDADTLSSLGAKRDNFLNIYMRVTGGTRANLLDFTIEKLQAYSLDSTLHPSARVNAIVLMKLLTDRPLTRQQAPVASANAFKALLSIFSGTDPKKNPEFVRVAAMSGILYQLDLNSKSGQTVDPAAKTKLLAKATELMAAPADRKKDAGCLLAETSSHSVVGNPERCHHFASAAGDFERRSIHLGPQTGSRSSHYQNG